MVVGAGDGEARGHSFLLEGVVVVQCTSPSPGLWASGETPDPGLVGSDDDGALRRVPPWGIIFGVRTGWRDQWRFIGGLGGRGHVDARGRR